MKRSGFKDGLELSITVRIIILLAGIGLLVLGVALVEKHFILGLVFMALGVLAAFIGMENSGGVMGFSHGVRDPRRSSTRKKGGYYQRESGYPWDQMGKGER